MVYFMRKLLKSQVFRQPQIHRHFCPRRPKPFLKKGFWTPKNFSLGWLRYSFFLRVPLWLKLDGGFRGTFSLDKLKGLP